MDDRLAIIGSANINERSQRGDRDSELAAIVKDTDLIDRLVVQGRCPLLSFAYFCHIYRTMAGQPFKVGRFAHTLRVRLMREHLGIDVDALSEEDVMAHQPKPEHQQWPLETEPDLEQEDGNEGGPSHLKKSTQKTPIGVCANQSKCSSKASRFVCSYICASPAPMGEESMSAEIRKVFRHEAPGGRTLGEEDFNEKGQKITGIANAVIRTLEEKAITEERPLNDQTDETTLKDQTIIEESESVSVQSGHTGLVNGGPHEPSTMDSGASAKRKSLSLRSDADSEDATTSSARETLKTNLGSRSRRKPWTVPTMKPKVGPQDFEDPISDAFWKDIWVASAVHNVSTSSWASIINDSMSRLCADHALRLRYTGRFSMPSLTILLPPGNNTRSLWLTTNVLTNPYV